MHSVWASLPRYSQQQVALQQTAITYFSSRVAAPDFTARLCAHLGQALRAQVSLAPPELRCLPRHEVLAQLPDAGFFALLGASPSPHKLVLEVDAALAGWAVERLLAGEAAQGGVHMARPPTELELGVLTYLLLDVLQLFAGELQGGQELSLSIDRMLGTSHALAPLLEDGDALMLQLGVRVQIEQRLGVVRLFLPQSFVSGYFGAALPDVSANGADWPHVRRCLQALPQHPVPVRAIGAHIALSAEDMQSVEVGDIVVLDEHALSATPEGIVGSVMLRIGEGQNGGVRTTMRYEANEAVLEITDFVVEHQAPGAQVAQNGEEEGDNLPQTEGLLRDVPAPVAVELGRLRLNAAQIVRLRTGQVLRLARAATDPVDLVVHNKLFARGELIEVDGELGVRLTHVTGESS